MIDMPKSAQRAYKHWIKHFPESYSRTDMDLFYSFVKVLVHSSPKERPASWLEKNMRDDRPDLDEKVIQWYSEIFLHLRDYDTVHKRHTFKLITQSEFEEMRKSWQQ